MKKSTSLLDKLGNQPIVKLSKQETPPDGASNTTQGLTDHAGVISMAAESYSSLALSSRQLLPPAVDGSFDSRQVEYVPPPDALIARFAFAVCRTLAERIPSARFGSTETRQGFQQFMVVVARIVASQANEEGAEWKTKSEPESPSRER